MSDFIPNSFQCPNIYVDKYLELLTPEEFKVLIFMVRRIFGFNKRQDRIARSQFEHGIISRDGEVLTGSMGLSRPAIRKAMDGLIKFGLVVVVEPHDAVTQTPALYSLEFAPERIDMNGLIERSEAKADAGRQRTGKARVLGSRVVGLTGGPGSGTDRGRVVGLTHNTQLETQYSSLNTNLSSINRVSKSRALEISDEEFVAKFSTGERKRK